MDLFVHTVKLLKACPRTVPDLIELVGIHEATAYRYIRSLREHGLIAKDGKRKKHMGKPSDIWHWQQ